jgi:hypothetical protein
MCDIEYKKKAAQSFADTMSGGATFLSYFNHVSCLFIKID